MGGKESGGIENHGVDLFLLGFVTMFTQEAKNLTLQRSGAKGKVGDGGGESFLPAPLSCPLIWEAGFQGESAQVARCKQNNIPGPLSGL